MFVDHFVALGGPFLGTVEMTRAALITGHFPPLDNLFSESEVTCTFVVL